MSTICFFVKEVKKERCQSGLFVSFQALTLWRFLEGKKDPVLKVYIIRPHGLSVNMLIIKFSCFLFDTSTYNCHDSIFSYMLLFFPTENCFFFTRLLVQFSFLIYYYQDCLLLFLLVPIFSFFFFWVTFYVCECKGLVRGFLGRSIDNQVSFWISECVCSCILWMNQVYF